MEPIHAQNLHLSEVMEFIGGSETPTKKLHSQKSDKLGIDPELWKDHQNVSLEPKVENLVCLREGKLRTSFQKKFEAKKIIRGEETQEELNFKNTTITESLDQEMSPNASRV